MPNLFFILLTSIFNFPIFGLTIAIIWNNLAAFCACIIYATTSSIDFGVLVCVTRFLDPSVDDPISCTNMLINLNSNGNPCVDPSLLIDNYVSDGLNSTKEGSISTILICNPIACRPSFVYYCYCYKCCCKCWKCCELPMVSIQSSYTSPSKCRYSSPSKNLASYSCLTSCLYSLSFPS